MGTQYKYIPYNVDPSWKMKAVGYQQKTCRINNIDIKDSLCYTAPAYHGHKDMIATHIHYSKQEYIMVQQEEKEELKERKEAWYPFYWFVGISLMILLFILIAPIFTKNE